VTGVFLMGFVSGFDTAVNNDTMFSIVPIIVVLGFIIIAGIIIYRIIQGGMEWNDNNNSPVLMVNSKIVAKRTQVQGHGHHANGNNTMHHNTTRTTYFVTFEVESGDRIELKVKDKEYGMLAEGDIGKLTFQGTRYKGFERKK